MLVADLQSWARCSVCRQVLWVEPPNVNADDQQCGCVCGGLSLDNGTATGTVDGSFTESLMQMILDAEYG